MNINCDNYSDCNSMVLDQGSVAATVAKARARGWHLFTGPSLTGKPLDVVLCDRCVGTPRSRVPEPIKNFPEQEYLFGTMEVEHGPEDPVS